MTYEEPAEQGVARAYVYSGEWVADCPRTGCGNVEFLFTQSRMNGPRDQRKSFYQCSSCGYACAKILFPRQEHQILEVLMRRPVPHNRNWYPADHPVAINFRLPHGQSVQELLEENAEHGVI